MNPLATARRSTRLTRRTLAGALGVGALGLAAVAPPWARPAAARQEATPAPSGGGGSLADLLRLVPDPFPAASADFNPLAYHADIAGQLEAVGLTPPTDPESEEAFLWGRAMQGLSLPNDVAQFARSLPWEEMFGWTPYQLDQSLWFGQPPQVTNLLRGRFDDAAVGAALLDLGFLEQEIAGATAAYSIEHKDLELSNPDERFFVTSSMRTLAILADGTHVWSQRPEGARAVAAVAAGDASLGARSPVQSLLEAVAEPLASSLLLPGLALAGGDSASLILDQALTPGAVDDLATAIAAAESQRLLMPPVGLALFGVTYGGEFVNTTGTPAALPAAPTATALRFYLQFGGPDAAAQAVPVIAERLETGRSVRDDQPWSEVFTDWSVAVVPDQAVVLVEIDPGLVRHGWFSFLFNRDLGFLAW